MALIRLYSLYDISNSLQKIAPILLPRDACTVNVVTIACPLIGSELDKQTTRCVGVVCMFGADLWRFRMNMLHCNVYPKPEKEIFYL